MAQTAVFEYTNHRGDVGNRTVMVDRIVWMDDPGYGYEPGWFVIGVDLDRKEQRQFRLGGGEHARPSGDFPISAHGRNILVAVR